jgi:hypothetical protein
LTRTDVPAAELAAAVKHIDEEGIAIKSLLLVAEMAKVGGAAVTADHFRDCLLSCGH